ncbi:unnamed protein product [Cylicocyclus nassatus]|uniref:Uncharacterized protein n=1 Tax=Cylicocyclus nassatus TaxID=53992 RepID=A0AA36HCW8_CYLNA|nr:unnamed protein product [Cylicocyclus nassatus]
MIYLLILLMFVAVVVAQSESPLTSAKMDELISSADDLVRDYGDVHSRLTTKVRTRLVILLLQLIPAEKEVDRLGDADLKQKFDNIILLLEKKLKIKYTKIKERLSNIITRFLEPMMVPLTIMQVPSQEEIQQALVAFENIPPSWRGGNRARAALTALRENTSQNEVQPAPEKVLPSKQVPQNSQLQTLEVQPSQTFPTDWTQAQPPQPQQFSQPQYLSTSQELVYQPVSPNYFSDKRYAREYDYTGSNSITRPSQPYYLPTYQYNSYQPTLQYPQPYYWQQPVQQTLQRQPAYYWVYPNGRIYYDQNQYYPY